MRVLIGEDEALLRERLTLVLHEGGVDVVASAGTPATVVGTVFPDLTFLCRYHSQGEVDCIVVAELRPLMPKQFEVVIRRRVATYRLLTPLIR